MRGFDPKINPMQDNLKMGMWFQYALEQNMINGFNFNVWTPWANQVPAA